MPLIDPHQRTGRTRRVHLWSRGIGTHWTLLHGFRMSLETIQGKPQQNELAQVFLPAVRREWEVSSFIRSPNYVIRHIGFRRITALAYGTNSKSRITATSRNHFIDHFVPDAASAATDEDVTCTTQTNLRSSCPFFFGNQFRTRCHEF